MCAKSSSEKPVTILVVTPGLKGGSWTRLNDMIKRAPSAYRFVVVGYGKRPAGLPANCRVWAIPYFEYSTKTFLPYHPFFSVFFSLPLMLGGYVAALLRPPRTVICNGLVVAFCMLPWAKLFRRPLLVSYHGWTEHNIRGLAERLTIALGKHLDAIFTNSEGSCRDLCRLIDQSRVHISEHYADPAFFEVGDPSPRAFRHLDLAGKYVVTYAGRIVEETNVGPLVRAIPDLLRSDGRLCFCFCGEGDELVSQLKELSTRHPQNVAYLGYVREKHELAALFAASDLIWSCGDDTYLTRPAVEALACGRPIIIPDRPNVSRKKEMMDVRVPDSLVPADVGRLIPADDVEAAKKVILDYAQGRIAHDAAAIRDYARQRYSVRNLDNILDALKTYAGDR